MIFAVIKWISNSWIHRDFNPTTPLLRLMGTGLIIILGTQVILPLPALALTLCVDSLQKNALKDESREDIENLILRSERLEIKVVDSTRAEDVFSIWANPESMKMSGDRISKLEVMLLLKAGQKSLAEVKSASTKRVNFGVFKNRELVGMAQVTQGQENSVFKTGIAPTGHTWVSLSYHFKPQVWGQGLATETASRLLHFAFETLNVDGVHLETIESNTGSQNIAKKLGFQKINYSDKYNLFHYALERAQYESMP